MIVPLLSGRFGVCFFLADNLCKIGVLISMFIYLWIYLTFLYPGDRQLTIEFSYAP